MYQRESIVIVDGYNVLRTGRRYRRILDPDYTDEAYNTARERLINDVAVFAGDRPATIVFDAADNDASSGSAQLIGHVEVIFTAAGQPADTVIERLARKARTDGFEATVVTSDAAIQETVFGGGIVRMSTEGFCREMDVFDADARADDQLEAARKNTVAERIDADTLAKLKALRDA